jgi:hypothetical protein
MKYNYTYSIILYPNLELDIPETISKIKSVLHDSNGWIKFGYSFIEVNEDANFIITIAPNRIIKRICNFTGLSCADSTNPKRKIIYLNLERWLNGSKKSKLSLDKYKNYMINHETGHILGKGHLKSKDFKPNTICPIMVQQTKGIGHLKPNCYPTIDD